MYECLLFCQSAPILNFEINTGEDCATALQKFKDQYNVLIAYNPSLSQVHTNQYRIIKGTNRQEIFEKLCYIYNLDFIRSDVDSYLVRTDADQVLTAEDIVLHIKLEEQSDGTPIPFASIFDASKTYFGFTDEFGDCFIKVPKVSKGMHFNVHSLSHQDFKFTMQEDQQYKKITMQESTTSVLPVMINTLKKKMQFAKQNGIQIDDDLLNKMNAASIYSKDVFRTVQMMPGVNAINDAKSNIRIRGANEEATLLILDNMPVYKADHFYGVFGAFNTWYIRNLTLHRNNIPVEYGGRTSGMVKMQSDDQAKVFNLNADINLLNMGLMVDAPIGNNFLLKLSGRQSFTNLGHDEFYDLTQRDNLQNDQNKVNTKNLVLANPDFKFSDLNSRLVYRYKKHQIDANFFASTDRLINKYNITYETKFITLNDEIFKQVSAWDNRTYGLNYNYTGKNIKVDANVYQTKYYSNYDIFSQLTRKEGNRIVKDSLTIFNNNSIQDRGGKVALRFNKPYGLLLGIEHIKHDNQLYIENDKNPVFEINKTGDESNFFTQITLGKKDGWYVEPALRTTYLHDLSKFYVLPQFYISKYISDGWLVKASAGKQVQFVRQFEHENLLGQKQQFFTLSNGKNIPVGIGHNYMLGGWKSSGKFSFDVEAYYRNVEGAIIHATKSPGVNIPNNGLASGAFSLFNGQARVYGADFSIVFEDKNFFSMMNYTLSKSENRFVKMFQNQYFPSTEDSRHQFKWLNTMSLSQFEFSLSYIGATGRPYLDLSSLNNNIERQILNINDHIKYLSNYHRIDLGIYYNMKIFSQSSKFGFSIFNLTNRVNVKYRQFVYQLAGTNANPINTILGTDVAQLERTFNLSFQLSIK